MKLAVCWSGLVAALAHVGLALGEETRVYLAPDDHTDYWWSADEDTYRQAFVETLDYYLDAADSTAANPPEHQSRWNCDGSFWLWAYEKSRTPEAFERLIERIRDGHIGVPLNGLCVCLGAAPAEAVVRGMYYPGLIERRYGVRFRLAYTMENQTQPLGLWSLWRGSGARYSWKGICGCDSRVQSAGNRPHEIYRAVGLDGSEMLVKWNSMLWGNQNMGGYAEARNPAAIVDHVTVNAPFNGFSARYPYDVIGCFGKGWDDLKTMTLEFVTAAIAKTTAQRKVIVSSEEDFFRDFEERHGAGLPVESVTYGNEWDLYCASLAETSARVKRAVEKLRAAEAMAVLAALFDPSFLSGKEGARERAWMDLGIFWEHNFGMVGPPTGSKGVAGRVQWQKRLADEIEGYVQDLHDGAADRLGALIPAEGGSRRFYVFNPLSWPRTDVADLPWPDPDPVHVVDGESRSEVRSQVLTRGASRFLRVLASDVPAVGYKVFEIWPGAGSAFADAAAVAGGNTLDNSTYRVAVGGNGAITSWKDLRRGETELVKVIGGRAANDLGPGEGSVAVENAGPVSVTLRAGAPSPVPHESRVTLFHGVDRVDLENEILGNFSDALTWSFGFSLEKPDTRHEEVGAVVRARLASEGGHYAQMNARYDWLTANHFVDMTGEGPLGVVLSNADCYFMKLGESTLTSLDASTPRIRILAGGRVANGDNGLPAQGGETRFFQRFALRAHGAHDPVAAMKFSLEHQNPLVARVVTGTSPALPPRRFSMVSLSNPSVLLWALKPAEEGIEQGIIARLWNISSEEQTATLQLAPFPVRAAKKASHIETDEEPVSVTAEGVTRRFARQEMQTLRLAVGRGAESPFRRGNCNADAEVDISDPVRLLVGLFSSLGLTACDDACDANDDGILDISDAIALLSYLFAGGPPPAAPFADCGSDGTPDVLACTSFPCPVGGL